MTETKATTRNCSIDIFRYICAILVVAIHTNPFAEISQEVAYAISQVIARVGVPFFFAVAGYFYTQKLIKGKKPFISYLKRILTTYGIWSVIYLAISFVNSGNANFVEFAIDSVVGFVVSGTYYHFWFFPALIFATVLTTVLFKMKCSKIIIPVSAVLYIVGCLGCAYYELGIQVPVLERLFTFSQFRLIRRVLLMGFPFFVCGYVVYRIQEKIRNVSNSRKWLFIAWIGACVIWLAEAALVVSLKWQSNMAMTLGMYAMIVVTVLVLLNHPLTQCQALSDKCRVLANFTYYAHPLCILCIKTVASKLFYVNIPETLLFVITVGATCICGLLIRKCNNKYLNYLAN